MNEMSGSLPRHLQSATAVDQIQDIEEKRVIYEGESEKKTEMGQRDRSGGELGIDWDNSQCLGKILLKRRRRSEASSDKYESTESSFLFK